ncbi:hypothetical protein [Hornefia butyriciproducens]|uniref:hypothetical protein n=1 Tax=Hornefia butyriciproducens TaxID=2652293 RepID=UPI002A750C14|nr:hypothetical protein [Hornefia butyriciproducens]MDY2990353.1 hypothetical protein [Hornefia butyriciproducens]MDY6211996.1 hypothetical protein [Hornefia butyriciproducens]
MSRLELLRSNKLLDVYNGCIDCLDNGNLSNDEVEALNIIKTDERRISDGWPIYSLAYSLLDIYDIEKYSGNDVYINKFLEMWNN